MKSTRKIQLQIASLQENEKRTDWHTLLLQDVDAQKVIPAIIHSSDALPIVLAMNKTKEERPLTQHLFSCLLDLWGMKPLEINIIDMEKGIFFTSMLLEKGDEMTVLDARLSDAVFVSVKYNIPIYIGEGLFNRLAVSKDNLEEHKAVSEEPFKGKRQDKTKSKAQLLKDLHKALEQAIQQEKYEEASDIKRQIDHLQ